MMAYSTPTAEPVSPKVDLAIEQQLQEANVYISQMKRYLHTNKKNELYPRCAAFIRWVIQEGEVPYGYSIKDLTLGVFYFRWNIKTLDPVLMAEYFDGTTDVAIRESAATWMVLYDEFWQHYALDIKYKKKHYTVCWPRQPQGGCVVLGDQRLVNALNVQLPLKVPSGAYTMVSVDDETFATASVNGYAYLRPHHHYIISRKMTKEQKREMARHVGATAGKVALWVLCALGLLVVGALILLVLI